MCPMAAHGDDPKVMGAGREQGGGLEPLASEDGNVLEKSLALPALQPSLGQPKGHETPLEEEAWLA